jgi:hypothetical protein
MICIVQYYGRQLTDDELRDSINDRNGRPYTFLQYVIVCYRFVKDMLMPGSVSCVTRLADVQAEEAKKKKKQHKDDEDLYLACFAAHSAHMCVLQEVHTWLVSLAAHILHPKYRTRFLTPSLVTILAGLIQYSWPR